MRGCRQRRPLVDCWFVALDLTGLAPVEMVAAGSKIAPMQNTCHTKPRSLTFIIKIRVGVNLLAITILVNANSCAGVPDAPGMARTSASSVESLCGVGLPSF